MRHVETESQVAWFRKAKKEEDELREARIQKARERAQERESTILKTHDMERTT